MSWRQNICALGMILKGYPELGLDCWVHFLNAVALHGRILGLGWDSKTDCFELLAYTGWIKRRRVDRAVLCSYEWMMDLKRFGCTESGSHDEFSSPER